MAVRAEDGAVNIALMKPDGKGLREVTGGDSMDECPAWVPTEGDKHVLVYQSARIGRNAQGIAVEQGPYAVFQLDTDGGEMKTLLESDAHDYLAPRVGADGSLYYIERPYQPQRQPVSPLKVGLDILLFPFRLVLAIVHFFDWFSLVFRRKPLLTAGGPPREGPDARHMMLWGKLVDAERAKRERGAANGSALVPKTWTLRRRRPGGDDRALATHVVSFDLCPDGGLVYTDGTTIYRLDPAGQSSELARARLIERVVYLGGA